MAAAARVARSRQVAEPTADVLAVLRQVQDEGAGSLRTIAAGLQARSVLNPCRKSALVSDPGVTVADHRTRGEHRDAQA